MLEKPLMGLDKTSHLKALQILIDGRLGLNHSLPVPLASTNRLVLVEINNIHNKIIWMNYFYPKFISFFRRKVLQVARYNSVTPPNYRCRQNMAIIWIRQLNCIDKRFIAFHQCIRKLRCENLLKPIAFVFRHVLVTAQ